ncbi:hypothetical protein [Streptomyces sp. 6N223]|uniref:hypothetical protein n=1 Tax=Streptomyces sp. 6N223 TaxID=3457412 RepID=UPI003FD34651
MDTAVIIAVAAIVAAAVLFFALGRGAVSGRERLKRRFGPEYHRAVAREQGDVKAAGRELRARVARYGSIRERPLPPGIRERYTVQWIEIQQRFVDAPQEALTETETLLARLAKDRGYPDGQPVEEQIAAISVHHGDQVHGYRSVHAAVHDQVGTEEMRRAMTEARGLFDALTAEEPTASARRREHAPWAFARR